MNTKPFYSSFINLVVGLLLATLALRLTWELLAPVLVPLAVLSALTIIARIVWLHTGRY